MKTEIIEIISAGLSGDKNKVINYTKTLAKNVKDDGDENFSKRLLNVLNNVKGRYAYLEEFSTKPIDQESRLDIVDIIFPEEIDVSELYFNKYLKKEIESFINEHKMKDKLLEKGIQCSNSLLLYGVPGGGKTSIAKYIAKLSNLPIVIAKFDSLVSSLLGNTAKNIKKVFDYAKKRECVLFLDEFDVIAKARDDKNELGELKRVVNSLIQNIDAYNEGGNILIAATNHQKLLDPAVWRRFNKIIEIKLPDDNEIYNIIKMNNNFKYVEQIFTQKSKYILNLFKNMSPSDINTILNNTTKKMCVDNKEQVEYLDLLSEFYLFDKHTFEDEFDFIRFMLKNNVTISELNQSYDLPLRKLREISKEINSGE